MTQQPSHSHRYARGILQCRSFTDEDPEHQRPSLKLISRAPTTDLELRSSSPLSSTRTWFEASSSERTSPTRSRPEAPLLYSDKPGRSPLTGSGIVKTITVNLEQQPPLTWPFYLFLTRVRDAKTQRPPPCHLCLNLR